MLGHLAVLLRVRLLPRRDLVRLRLYFLLDGLTSLVTAFCYTGRLRWLVALHVLQHLYYFCFWEKTTLAKRVVNWSSLEFQQTSKCSQWEIDNVIGTLFDVVVHICNICALAGYLSTVQIVMVLVFAQCSICCVLYNPRFAWASPSAMPPWVQKRLTALSQ